MTENCLGMGSSRQLLTQLRDLVCGSGLAEKGLCVTAKRLLQGSSVASLLKLTHPAAEKPKMKLKQNTHTSVS